MLFRIFPQFCSTAATIGRRRQKGLTMRIGGGAARNYRTLIHGYNGCDANKSSKALPVQEGQIDNLWQMIEDRKIQNSQPQ